MHSNSKLLFLKYVKDLIKKEHKVLEIGPDSFPSTFNKITGFSPVAWDTLDLYKSPSLTYEASQEYNFQIPNESYDIVLSGQVIEHVKHPWKWMPELARIVKTGGLVITINPVSWIYHEAPVDCWRIYPEGMKALYEDAGLTVLKSVWESLEFPEIKNCYPGVSKESQRIISRSLYRIKGILGIKVEKSYDTVTIGRKD